MLKYFIYFINIYSNFFSLLKKYISLSYYYFFNLNENIADDFIYLENNNLSAEICKEIINKFENSDNKMPGIVGDGLLQKEKKNTLDLRITNNNDWKDIDNYLCNKLFNILILYCNKIIRNKNNIVICDIKNNIYPNSINGNKNLNDFGYQVQKYEKNKGFYVWHNDFRVDNKGIRYITFIWYLNDVIEGGETEFLFGKIKPTTGKILLFPATWTYVHRGNIPISDNKYIVTGWVGL